MSYTVCTCRKHRKIGCSKRYKQPFHCFRFLNATTVILDLGNLNNSLLYTFVHKRHVCAKEQCENSYGTWEDIHMITANEEMGVFTSLSCSMKMRQGRIYIPHTGYKRTL